MMLKTQQLWLSERIGNLQCRCVEHSDNKTRSNSYVVASIDNLPGMEIANENSFFPVKNRRP